MHHAYYIYMFALQSSLQQRWYYIALYCDIGLVPLALKGINLVYQYIPTLYNTYLHYTIHTYTIPSIPTLYHLQVYPSSQIARVLKHDVMYTLDVLHVVAATCTLPRTTIACTVISKKSHGVYSKYYYYYYYATCPQALWGN